MIICTTASATPFRFTVTAATYTYLVGMKWFSLSIMILINFNDIIIIVIAIVRSMRSWITRTATIINIIVVVMTGFTDTGTCISFIRTTIIEFLNMRQWRKRMLISK